MSVTTWSFGSGFEGWTFREEIIQAPATASRSHVTGATRVTLTTTAGSPNRHVNGHNEYTGLSAVTTAGDTIEIDFTTTTDSKEMSVAIIATYSDLTTDSNVYTSIGGTTGFTLNLTGGKTLSEIDIQFGNFTGITLNHSRDLLEVRLTTAVDPSVPGDLRAPSTVLGNGKGAGKIASISADGLYIYIAAINTLSQPTLVKIGAGLTADGSVVFEPGGGDFIGVQCGKYNADVVWIAGSFGGTDVIEKSENAGGSFAVKDNGAMGTIRTFEVGPISDDNLLVFDGDNADILETINSGESWITTNSSVTPSINSISRLDIRPAEFATVNQGAATNSVNYSLNSGASLEDYQTGVYPNADGTKVITT